LGDYNKTCLFSNLLLARLMITSLWSRSCFQGFRLLGALIVRGRLAVSKIQSRTSIIAVVLIALFLSSLGSALGSRAVPGDIDISTRWSTGFTASWSISSLSDGSFSYTYAILGMDALRQGTDLPDFGMNGDLYRIRFDSGGVFFSFINNRTPVWGDFNAKGGDPNWGSLSLGEPPVSGQQTSVPEPGTLLLLGAGLLATALFLRRN
jgi:hypothetical protein